MNVMKLKYTDEQLHTFYENILRDLPDLDFEKINVGYGKADEPRFHNITIIPATGVQDAHIRVAFHSLTDGVFTMVTKQPVMTEYTVIAGQLVMLGVTDVSGMIWHTSKWDSEKDYTKNRSRRRRF